MIVEPVTKFSKKKIKLPLDIIKELESFRFFQKEIYNSDIDESDIITSLLLNFDQRVKFSKKESIEEFNFTISDPAKIKLQNISHINGVSESKVIQKGLQKLFNNKKYKEWISHAN